MQDNLAILFPSMPLTCRSNILFRMKPCIIGQIKIESRPQSAILKSKSVEINKFMGYGLKKHRTPTQK